MSNTSMQFGTDEILWYDNGRWGEAGYAIANPNQKVWTNNGSMLAEPRQLWAVAVPVTIRFDGDAHPGLPICGHRFIIREGEAPAEPEMLDAEAAQVRGSNENYPSADFAQGFDQSPQRSR